MNRLTSSYYSVCANSGHRNTCECCHHHTQANDDDSETCKIPQERCLAPVLQEVTSPWGGRGGSSLSLVTEGSVSPWKTWNVLKDPSPWRSRKHTWNVLNFKTEATSRNYFPRDTSKGLADWPEKETFPGGMWTPANHELPCARDGH